MIGFPLFSGAAQARRVGARSVAQRLVTAMLLAAGAVISPAHASTTPTKHAFVGVRVLKTVDAGMVDWSAELARACTGCRLVLNDWSSGQNPDEIFFHVWLPGSKVDVARIHLRVDSSKIRGVLVSLTDDELASRDFVRTEPRANGIARLDYREVADGVTFDVRPGLQGVSLPPDDSADVTEEYTFIETPGVYIRVGHADERRRRGAYATGRWPALEASAALNLEFAAREAIYALGLDKTVRKAGANTIMLMNFDTNFPTLGPDVAHDDWPPHWHMHLYWNDAPRVRKVGHFYLDPQGLLLRNMSSDFVSSTSPGANQRSTRRCCVDETKSELMFLSNSPCGSR